MSRYLYGLTVQGIQSYIFATNKLKEIIGASEIVEKLCTEWFNTFISEHGIDGTVYLNAAGNVRYESTYQNVKLIYEEYHKLLVSKAPGTPFSQAIQKIETNQVVDALDALDKKLEAQRNIPQYSWDLGNMARNRARRTGLAAIDSSDKSKAIDLITAVKLANENSSSFANKLDKPNLIFPKEFEKIAEESHNNWLAIVHIDGNRIGKRISMIKKSGGDVLGNLKNFSNEVNSSTICAFNKAIDTLFPDQNELPLRPIVLGGDDVTFIIQANYAIAFTKHFIQEFENQTKQKFSNGLSSCAGIAFVKQKFPFHYSAALAEELCKHAKNLSKREYSCLHFFRVQNSFIEDYEIIIEEELTSSSLQFNTTPYSINDFGINPVKSLLDDISELKKVDSPKNNMREWIDAVFNHSSMAEELWNRMTKKHPDKNNLFSKKEQFLDYLSLLAINQ